MPISFTEPIYSLDEAARVLGLSLKTVRNHINNDLIRTQQLSTIRGGRVIAESELRRFERERRPRGNPEFIAKRKAVR